MANQKEGVFAAVVKVLGEVNGAVTLTDAQKKAVCAELFAQFRLGTIEFKGGAPDDAKLTKYIPGLLNNWVRKDTRLNGGSKYETKKPGSRTGSGDASLKAMRMLRAATTDASALADIDAEIAKRQSELKPAVAVNVEALPPILRKYVAPPAS